MTPEEIRRALNPGPDIYGIMRMIVFCCGCLLGVVMTVCLSYGMIRATFAEAPQKVEATR